MCNLFMIIHRMKFLNLLTKIYTILHHFQISDISLPRPIYSNGRKENEKTGK